MKPDEPTNRQLATAQLIAGKLKRSIPNQALETELVMRMWIKSVMGLLSQKERDEIVSPKRHEQLLAAIGWYQKESGFEVVTCPHDGVALAGEQQYGFVSLQCPSCGYKKRKIPLHIEKLYTEASRVSRIE